VRQPGQRLGESGHASQHDREPSEPTGDLVGVRLVEVDLLVQCRSLSFGCRRRVRFDLTFGVFATYLGISTSITASRFWRRS
jgi:hypothetical protein